MPTPKRRDLTAVARDMLRAANAIEQASKQVTPLSLGRELYATIYRTPADNTLGDHGPAVADAFRELAVKLDPAVVGPWPGGQPYPRAVLQTEISDALGGLTGAVGRLATADLTVSADRLRAQYLQCCALTRHLETALGEFVELLTTEPEHPSSEDVSS